MDFNGRLQARPFYSRGKNAQHQSNKLGGTRTSPDSSEKTFFS